MTDSVVVTGLGFVSPLGTGAEEVWKNWCSGESGVRRLRDDDPRLARGVDPIALPDVGRAGWVRGFQPKEHIRSSHLRRMDWCSRMFVACATQAAHDAGLALGSDQDQVRTALVVGSCFGNQRETQKYMERVLRRGPSAGQPILFPNLVLNAAGGYAAIELSIRGPNLTVSEHEASGEIAVTTAVDLLRAGMCDRVVVGGADEFGSVYLGALRERRLLHADSTPGQARSNARRGRIVPGEGAAALVLESERSAHARGRRPYGAIGEAQSAAVEASPYGAGNPEREATRISEMVGPATVSAVLGGADGSAPRDDLDRALLDCLSDRQAHPPSYVRLDGLVGSWPSRGAFAIGLASLAAGHQELPGAQPAAGGLQRVVVPGSGRSGVLVPVAIDVLTSPE